MLKGQYAEVQRIHTTQPIQDGIFDGELLAILVYQQLIIVMHILMVKYYMLKIHVLVHGPIHLLKNFMELFMYLYVMEEH